MDLHRIDLNLLVAFEALAAERNVTRAARRLGLGQPAMSEALARLRRLFGDELFVRAAGAMQPTPRALRLAAEIGPVMAGLRGFLGAETAFRPEEEARAFTLGSGDYSTLVLLPVLLPMIRHAAPGIDLRIAGYEKDAAGPMLDRGEIDLALGVFPDPPENTVRSVLFGERFAGLARADHPAIASGRIGLEDFAALPHALVSLRRDASGAVDRALAAAGLRRRVALVVPYMLILADALAGSDLVAVLPERAARRMAGERLHLFELPLEVERFDVHMLWNPVARTDRATAWLRALVAEAAWVV